MTEYILLYKQYIFIIEVLKKLIATLVHEKRIPIMLPIGNSKKESEVDLFLICALAAVDCYSVFFALNL